MMATKFALYYGVKRNFKEGESPFELVELCERNRNKILKLQAKDDHASEKYNSKYSALVVASDFGIHCRYKLADPAEAKKAEAAKKKEEAAAKKKAEAAKKK